MTFDQWYEQTNKAHDCLIWKRFAHKAIARLAFEAGAARCEGGKLLAEMDSKYNQKTNALIERHAKQIEALRIQNAELLEALEHMVDLYAGQIQNDGQYGAIEIARTAIAKAKGN